MAIVVNKLKFELYFYCISDLIYFFIVQFIQYVVIVYFVIHLQYVQSEFSELLQKTRSFKNKTHCS